MSISWFFKNKANIKSSYTTFELGTEYTPELQESSYSVIEVILDGEDKALFSDIVIYIGDVEVKLFVHFNTDEQITLRTYPLSAKYDEFKCSQEYERIFHNYFGQSEILLSTLNCNTILLSKTIEVTMHRDKALCATRMLDFITENTEDIISLCFSKTKGGISAEQGKQDSFTQFEVLKDTINLLKKEHFKFFRNYKNTLEKQLYFEAAKGEYSDGVNQWVMSNLDMAYTSNLDNANIVINKLQAYCIDNIPSENLRVDTDNLENQVIHSFFKRAKQFLFRLKRLFDVEKIAINNAKLGKETSEYVRFDSVINKFKIPILNKKIAETTRLLSDVNHLSRLFSRHLPASSSKFVAPRFTLFVQTNKHYKLTFESIDRFYRESKPVRNNNSILLGLRNLSQIYEFTTLFGILNSIRKLGFTLEYSGEHIFSDKSFHGKPLDGNSRESLNNVYKFWDTSKPDVMLELFYEPQVNCLNSNSQAGDLIRVRNSAGSKYKYYCPDYIIRKTDINELHSSTFIFDAKFSTLKTVRKYHLDKLTQNYLLGIQELNNDNRFVSTVNYVGILFGIKDENKNEYHRMVENQHFVTGDYPISPQISAEHYMTYEDNNLQGILQVLLKD